MNADYQYVASGDKSLRTAGTVRDFDPDLLFNRAANEEMDAVMRLQHEPGLPFCCDI